MDDREEMNRLIESAHRGDRKARDRLVEANTGLVWDIVRRFVGRGQETEDLFQIGSIGLMKAIDKFDLSFQVRFSTYAVPMIAGEIRRFLRDDGMIKVSRSLKEQAAKAKSAREQLSRELGREPHLEELAARLGLRAEELAAALESGAEVESLSRPVYEADGREISLMDKLREERDECESAVNRLVVRQLIGELDETQRELILLRYFRDRTQSQTAQQLGMTQVQISRMEKKILKWMRAQIENQ